MKIFAKNVCLHVIKQTVFCMLIKNIIFDLGAVVINIDYEGPAKLLKEMGIHNFEDIYGKAKQLQLFDKFEKGSLPPNEFRRELKKLFKTDFNDREIDRIWNAVILDFPPETIKLILNLKKQYRTFLLSNTNIIHYELYTKDLYDKFNALTWDILFEKAYFSFEMGMRKPDLEIYKKVISDNNLNPLETVFIDDLLINIEGAQKCGLQTFWLKEGMPLTDVFREINDTNEMITN